MIVDLLRNDLGKCCVPGSIRAEPLFAIESFASVHHLVSTVCGRLAPGRGATDVIRACFPGGSITGKLPAMQIIEALNRSGATVCAAASATSASTWRTSTSRSAPWRCDEQICAWAGGGIVARFRSRNEYQKPR
jgi:para-aminobenzoate synthetase component 1